MLYPEGPVQTEHAYAVLLVEAGQDVEGTVLILDIKGGQPVAYIPHLLADVKVIHLLFLGDGMVIRDHRKTVDLQILLQRAEVIMHEFQKDAEIRLGETVHRSVACTHLLTGKGEGIFIGDQKKCKIIPPQIFVESIIRAEIKQSSHFTVSPEDKPVQLRPFIASGSVLKRLRFSHYLTNIIQYAALSEIPEHDQL